MKRYKVIFRYICSNCSHQDDVVFFFDSVDAAKRCIKLAMDKLKFDVCFLVDLQDNKLLIRFEMY